MRMNINVVAIATVATVAAGNAVVAAVEMAAAERAAVPLGKAVVVVIPPPSAPNLENAVEKLMNHRTRRGKHTKRCGDP